MPTIKESGKNVSGTKFKKRSSQFLVLAARNAPIPAQIQGTRIPKTIGAAGNSGKLHGKKDAEANPTRNAAVAPRENQRVLERLSLCFNFTPGHPKFWHQSSSAAS